MDDDKDIEIENTLIETEESDEAEDLEEIDGVIGEPLNIEDIDIELPQYMDESVSGTSLVRYDALQHYLAEVRKYRFLTREEEIRLAVRYKEEGDLDAISKLIMANLRLVVVIAMEYKNVSMNLMDLIQEGNLGLMQAVKKFDPYRNLRLVTYASWWVKAYILRYIINNWRLVKIGTTQAQRKLFFNLMKEKARLESLGYEAGPKLLASELGVKEKEVIEMGQRLGHHDMSVDEPLSEDSESTLLSVLSSGETPLDDRLADDEISSIFKEKVAEFSKGLNERDLDIMQNRILSEEPKSLSELGRSYDISKERVRQLEGNLIKRLKEYLQREVKDFDALRPD
ncbi:MAG: RNA polymerase factor sigma-32 [Nitrospirota bacterium]